MGTIGILVACTIRLASGEVAEIKGVETNERTTLKHEQILFDYGSKAEWVNSNDCLYLEDPVQARVRVQRQKQAQARKLAGVPKIVEGDDPWCTVDGYGSAQCFYQDMADCAKRLKQTYEYCIEKKNLEDSNASR